MNLSKISTKKLIDELHIRSLEEEDKKAYREKIERMDLGLYKFFGYPELKELSIEDMDFPETWADVYEMEIADLPEVESKRQNPLPKGRGFILFSEDDMKKLSKLKSRSIELIISDDNKLLVIMHW